MYRFKIFNSFTEECSHAWKNFEKDCSSNFFQDYEYIQEITKKNNNSTKIIIIYLNSKVVAILPLEIKKFFFVNMLQWIGTDYSDYCNPILSKNFEADYIKIDFKKVWKEILDDLKNEVDLVFFNNQLNYINETINPFVKNLKTTNFSKIYFIELKNNFENYKNDIKEKDKKHAYEIHRTLIKFEKLKQHSKNTILEVKNSYEEVLNLKQVIEEKKDQLLKKKVGNKLNNHFVEIFENLIKFKKTKFLLASLKTEETILAKCFCFIYKGVFYYYIPLISSNNFEKFKPGKILITELIKWCIKNDIKKFDFGLGKEKYKKYFSNKEFLLHRHLNFLSIKGFFAYFLISIFLKIKKLWL